MKQDLVLTEENYIRYLILADADMDFDYKKDGSRFKISKIKETMSKVGVEVVYVGQNMRDTSIHTLKVVSNNSIIKLETLKQQEPTFFNPNNLI